MLDVEIVLGFLDGVYGIWGQLVDAILKTVVCLVDVEVRRLVRGFLLVLYIIGS